ncbi:hypothetical protein [Janthinobacterium sp.]|uniref:hypothetical protein n=1 Tax=Janthinobacterium sp. TaxID=1871054 RepID=UPI00293D221B|nr:hypothetical protein [Janthinobacterium sp.]
MTRHQVQTDQQYISDGNYLSKLKSGDRHQFQLFTVCINWKLISLQLVRMMIFCAGNLPGLMGDGEMLNKNNA